MQCYCIYFYSELLSFATDFNVFSFAADLFYWLFAGGEVKWNKWRRATKWKSNVYFLFLFMFTAMPTLSHFRFSVWELPSCSSEITLTVRLQKAKNPWNNLTNLKRNISRKIAKWNTVKPFMTNKGTKSDDQITTNQWRENAIQFEAKHLTFVLQKVIW